MNYKEYAEKMNERGKCIKCGIYDHSHILDEDILIKLDGRKEKKLYNYQMWVKCNNCFDIYINPFS